MPHRATCQVFRARPSKEPTCRHFIPAVRHHPRRPGHGCILKERHHGARGRLHGRDAQRSRGRRRYTPAIARRHLLPCAGPSATSSCFRNPKAPLIVDSGLSDARPQIESAIAALSPRFPATLINTHWHVDHTDGNEWMHARGAAITAQRNTAHRLSTAQHTAAMHQDVPAAPPGARPTRPSIRTRTKRSATRVSHSPGTVPPTPTATSASTSSSPT